MHFVLKLKYVSEPIFKGLSLALQILVNKSCTKFYVYPAKVIVVSRWLSRWAWSLRKALLLSKERLKSVYLDCFTEKDTTSRRPTNFKKFEDHWAQKFDALQSPSERCGKDTLRAMHLN
jgi:hypothetical protein